MINITRQAKRQLKKILAANVDFPEGRLRLIDRGQGKLGLGIDIEMPCDELLECDGSTILVIERRLARSLEGVTLDIENNGSVPQLILLYG
jgi:Fe-S cluster assembly iron-binding protein IscA